MAVQFRQIGVPDARTTNAEVRQYLRRAQQRTESLLNRQRLPRPSALLNALRALRQTIQQAYSSLPLQRLQQLQRQLDTLADEVDRGAYFGLQPGALGADKALRRFYGDVTRILVDLTEPRPRQKPETEGVLNKFLETAAQRGWKVPEVQRVATQEHDGFVQSIDYLRKISIPSRALLRDDTDFGITTGSIVLMTEQPIPESTLSSWANQQEVYIVFGHYVVLPNVQLLGVLPRLAVIGEANGKGTSIDINRFVTLSELLHEGPVDDNLIRYPRRVRHHYYCPLVNVAGHDRRYFRTWDVLTHQQEQHGNTENTNR